MLIYEEADPARVEIRVLGFDWGDTTLVRLGGEAWGLIDCCLDTEEAVRRFFADTEKLGIGELKFAALTHPHYDHYAGMLAVIEEFSSKRNGVRTFCELDLHPREVALWMHPKDPTGRRTREFLALKDAIDRLKIPRISLHTGHRSVEFSDSFIRLVAVAPAEGVFHAARAYARKEQFGKVDVNDFVIVLVLAVGRSEKTLHVLFSSDAKTEQLCNAVSFWASHPENTSRQDRFVVIKVPHHGSLEGHSLELCEKRADTDIAVAAISGAPRYKLPKRDVILDYLNRDWLVLCTATQKRPLRQNRLINQFSNVSRLRTETKLHDIVISWTEEQDFRWGPTESRITARDAEYYPQ